MNDKPQAPDPSTSRRWEENQRRRRMMEGDWKEDGNAKLMEMVGTVRRAVMPEVDLSNNVALSVITQLATLYNDSAIPHHEQDSAVQAIKPWLDEAGHWQIMQGTMPLILAQREGFVLSEVVQHPWNPRKLVLHTRPHPADLVAVDAHPDMPDVPNWVALYRIRPDEHNKPCWTRDVYDLRVPEVPAFRIESADGKKVYEEVSGDEYRERWSYSDGTPFIPGEWYHAARTGKLENHKVGMELFEGALKLAAHWTNWDHILLDCSYPQKFIINGGVEQTASHEGDGIPYVVTDPSSVLLIRGEPGTTPIASQWEPGGDPEAIAETLVKAAARLATDNTVTPSDVARATGDARSGYAIELTQEGKRLAQKRYGMVFRRHDSRMLSKIAAMLTRSGAASIPDTGWDIHYQGIPLTLSERIQNLDELERLVEMNLISRPEALSRHEGIPLDTARKRLEESQADISRFRGA